MSLCEALRFSSSALSSFQAHSDAFFHSTLCPRLKRTREGGVKEGKVPFLLCRYVPFLLCLGQNGFFLGKGKLLHSLLPKKVVWLHVLCKNNSRYRRGGNAQPTK